MSDVLAVAELREGALRAVSRETMAAARGIADSIGGSVDGIALGPPGTADAVIELGRFGADRILVAEDDAFRHYHSDAWLRALEQVVGEGEYAAILLPASVLGKDLAPRLAVRLDLPLATEVTEIAVEDGIPVVTRPVYAGKALARVAFAAAPALISIRPNVFSAQTRTASARVETIAIPAEPRRQRVVGIERAEREKLDVSEATVIVSGGRGMQDPSNWGILEELAEALGPEATIGASRAVVDAGWRPHAEQVGQTGKVVSPDLYFAIGISGAIQHLAGMRTAKLIVAVNRDPDAPIFSVADYGIVGDLFEIVPRLTEEIRKARTSA